MPCARHAARNEGVFDEDGRDARRDDFAPPGVAVYVGDYTVGADKGGSVNMFDDFDIDYNQEKFLIETRCSGALVKPYSAIVVGEEVNPQ